MNVPLWTSDNILARSKAAVRVAPTSVVRHFHTTSADVNRPIAWSQCRLYFVSCRQNGRSNISVFGDKFCVKIFVIEKKKIPCE
jgi:hypothetical protein